LIIATTPFRDGKHAANTPSAFLPIINQLMLLHEKGFVHGDIRAFNTVFGNEDGDRMLD
jgi:RIO-like serine/threonine protein kinase